MCPCHLIPLLKKEKPGTGIFSGAVEVRILRGALYLTAPYFYDTETNGSHAKNHCSKEGTGIMMPFLCPISPHLTSSALKILTFSSALVTSKDRAKLVGKETGLDPLLTFSLYSLP